MGYRILVDENTRPRVAEILRVKGHTATHVHCKLNEGADDRTILEFARRQAYLLFSHDPGFLDPETAACVVHVVAVRRWLDLVGVARLREVALQRELVVRRGVVGAGVAPEPV